MKKAENFIEQEKKAKSFPIKEVMRIAEIARTKSPYISVYRSIGGWKAVLLTWNEELQFYEPWQTSVMGGFASKEEAIEDGKNWARHEEIQFVE